MSDDAAAKPKKKGGGPKKMIIIVGAVLLLGGGGAAAGFYAAGSIQKEAGPVEDPNRPHLVKKGETAESVAAAHGYVDAAGGDKGGGGDHGGGGGGGEGGEHAAEGEEEHHQPVDLPRPKNPSAYQATYFQIPQPFTSNMADSDAFAQISIAVSTYYDIRVIRALEAHELALRSEILMMLAQEEEMALATPEGKEKLQKKLVKTINHVLMDKTGYSGVDNVYFTNFVIQ